MRIRRRTFLLVILLIQAAPLVVQPSAHPEAFRQPPREQHGPWNRDLDLFESEDGFQFAPRGVFVERGGVPNLLLAKGKLYCVFQWFPSNRPEAFDKIAVKISEDGGMKWSDPIPIAIEGMPKHLVRAFDPTLVLTESGIFRLYFASDRVKQGRKFRLGNRGIFSALSKDAIHFKFEEGQRFGFEDAETYDPAVAYFRGQWHLFCPKDHGKGQAYHAISSDGLRFDEWEEVGIPFPATWIGNVIVANERLRFCGSGRWLWAAYSSDGSHWNVDPSFRLSGGDPAIVQLPNGSYLAVTTSAPRRNERSPRSQMR